MSEIEKQFFETFGIKPKKQCYYWDCPYSTGEIAKDTPINERDCVNCTNPDKEVYPSITDNILLKLICIAHTSPVITFTSRDIKELKNEVLLVLCNWVNHRDIKQQVQELFKETEK